MGPTNVALVKLFRADQALREAQGRLEAATKNVRIQERRTSDLAEKLKLAQTKLRELQAKASTFELDVKTRDARIEKLRTQQQNAKNNKEYQTFLLEISTEKIDRGKSEDEQIKVMEVIETSQAEIKELTALHDAEVQKLTTLRAHVGESVAKLTGEVDALRPAREAAAKGVSARVLQIFDRLADRYEGEALSAMGKPDRRREEYLCGGCNMDLVADVYNRLHTRDELIACTSCGRMLYIPEDLPPEVAINSRGKAERSDARDARAATKAASGGTTAAPRARRTKTVEKLDPSERRAKGQLGTLLTRANGESVKIALDAGLKPVECEVIVDGKPQGVYKGKSAEHLQRIIEIRMQEAEVTGAIEVREKVAPPSEEPTPEPAPAGETPVVEASAPAGESAVVEASAPAGETPVARASTPPAESPVVEASAPASDAAPAMAGGSEAEANATAAHASTAPAEQSAQH